MVGYCDASWIRLKHEEQMQLPAEVVDTLIAALVVSKEIIGSKNRKEI